MTTKLTLNHSFIHPTMALAAAAILAWQAPATGQNAPDYTIIHARNDLVPGAGIDPRIPAGSVFTAFSEPAIDNASRMAFRAKWASGNVGGNGILVDNRLIVAAGEPVRGVAGATWKSFQDPVIGASGRIAFIGTLAGVSTAADEVVASNAFDADGALTIIAREDNLALGAPVGPGRPRAIIGRWKSFSSLSLQALAGDRHGLLFTGYLKTDAGIPRVTAANDCAAWLCADVLGAAPVLVVREGGPAPGLPGQTIKSFDLLRAAFTTVSQGQGRGHFRAENVDVPVTLTPALPGQRNSPQALLRWWSGSASLAALSGDPAPIAGTRWNSVGPVSHGTAWFSPLATFAGSLAPGVGGVTPQNAAAIFSLEDTGTGNVLLRAGDPAPGLNGVFLKSFKAPVADATGGGVAVPAYLTGAGVSRANDFALLWGNSSGGFEILARNGDQVPGTPAGTRWSGGFSLAYPEQNLPLFTASLTGIGVGAANDRALYTLDRNGALLELLREGQRLFGRTVSTFHLLTPLPGTAGASRSFNNQGQVAVLVGFTDRTSALVRINSW